MSDDYIAAVKRLIRERPVEEFQIKHTRRHRRLVLAYAGSRHTVVFPTSSSDSRHGVRNFVADVARTLDALGVPRPLRRHSPQRARARCAAPRPVTPPAEKAGPRVDWRDTLRSLSVELFGGQVGMEA